MVKYNKTNKRTKKRINKRTKKRINKRTKKRINKRTKKIRKKNGKKGGANIFYSTNNMTDALNYIKNNTVHLDYEICGTMEEKEGIINVVKHTIPTVSSSSRKMCNYEYYDSIIWHTHPIGVKFYPSIEDIEKVIKEKNKKIKESFIITNFGVWYLQSINHINIDSNMKHNIQYLCDELYYGTERGRQFIEEPVRIFITKMNELLRDILVIDFHII
jgi:hypothetical protein